MDWQPIETAPKDGTEVVGWFPYHSTATLGGSVFVMRWNDDRYHKRPVPYWEASGWVWGRRDQREKQPTHWMPLPDPPAMQAERTRREGQ